MKVLSQIYFILLTLASIGMLVWGVAGFFEYFTGITPIIALQNDMYPNGVQFVHWFLITLTGGTFLLGYLTKWKWTPFAMILLYSNLSVLCTIQTFDFMSEQWSISSYIFELISYVIHGTFLMKSRLSKSIFKHAY